MAGAKTLLSKAAGTFDSTDEINQGRDARSLLRETALAYGGRPTENRRIENAGTNSNIIGIIR
jgi:hypothetical protein